MAVLDALVKSASLSHHCASMPQKDEPKQLLPVIVGLKRWREENDLSQLEACQVLNEAGIGVTLDSIQNWEVGRWSPRARVALALADYLRQNPKVRKKAARRPELPPKEK
jgi:DNA-binding XRE family transcriptional regulator